MKKEVKRWEKLFEESYKKTEERDKRYLAKLMYEQDKEMEDCTFQPNIDRIRKLEPSLMI